MDTRRRDNRRHRRAALRGPSGVGLFLFVVQLIVFSPAGRAVAQPAVRAGVVANGPAITAEHFERWVFQQYRTETAARKNFLSELTLKIAELDRICQLTEKQRRKLSLAGRGDINRFFSEYQHAKRAFQDKQQDEKNVTLVFQEIAPLQTAIQAGLFQRDSIVQRSLSHVLTESQRNKYVRVQRERVQFRHRAAIELAISLLEQAMPLKASQREMFINTLVRRTRPPLRSGQHDYYSIMFQASQLPEATFQSFLNETQWHVVHQQFDQALSMKVWLEKRGGLPEEGSADDWW